MRADGARAVNDGSLNHLRLILDAPDLGGQISNSDAVGTAELEISALALGQARAALAALVDLSPDRTDLAEPLESTNRARIKKSNQST